MSNEAKVTQPNTKPLSDNLTSRLKVIREMDKFTPEVIDRFGVFLENAPDQELFRMSPFRYAEQTNTATQDAIDLFLHATHVGILEFNWGVLCPSCGAFLTTKSGLRWLQSRKTNPRPRRAPSLPSARRPPKRLPRSPRSSSSS